MRPRNWEIVLLVLAVLSLLLWGGARTLGARATTREAAVSRIARPGVAFWGEPVDVELRIDADRLPACAAVGDVEPIYAALVIDHSGSMAGAPLSEARNGASDFVDLMNLTEEEDGGDAVSVVMFSDAATLLTSFSYDRSQVVRVIQSIPSGGGTDIAAGLSLAAQQFLQNPPPADARPVIILLSDGQSDASAAIAAADQAKAQNIRVVTIALGDADQSTLSQIASSAADYYETADPTTLMAIYGEIAAGMVGVAASDVSLVEYYNDARFDLVGGLYRAEQSGGQITWQLPFVGRRGRSVGYFLRPRTLGYHQVSPAAGQMSLTDCAGQPLNQTTPDGPRVLVLFPVWLLYIFPALALLWLLYRLVQALRRPAPKQVGPPPSREGDVGSPKPVETEKEKRRGADVTHGQTFRPMKRDEKGERRY